MRAEAADSEPRVGERRAERFMPSAAKYRALRAERSVARGPTHSESADSAVALAVTDKRPTT